MKKAYSLLAAVLAGSLAAHALTVTKGNIYTRPSGATYPDPLSGITYAGENGRDERGPPVKFSHQQGANVFHLYASICLYHVFTGRVATVATATPTVPTE